MPVYQIWTVSKARSVARNNLFLSADDYFKRYKEVDPKLPSHPDVVYQDQWQGWRDFLSSRKIYETFEEAKTAARLIQFRGTTHYKKQCKKFDKKLPIKPENSYRNEWTNWRDFLGTPQKEFYSTYEEARRAVPKGNFTSSTDYFARRKEVDPKLPSRPATVYSEDWVDWFHYLQKERNYETYAIAKIAAHKCKFSGARDYIDNAKSMDSRLPANPNITYKDEWISWHDYLGTTPIEYYNTYAEAKKAAEQENFTGQSDYRSRRKNVDPKLPPHPNLTYTNDWIDWNHFLSIEVLYESYLEAKRSAKNGKFINSLDYADRHKTFDPKLPTCPYDIYSEDWVDWYDYLAKPYSLDKFRKFILLHGAIKKKQYDVLAQKYQSLPKDPCSFYQFKSYKEIIEFEYYDFEKSKIYCHENRIKNTEEYIAHAKNNPYLRAHPAKIEGYTSFKELFYHPEEFEYLLDLEPKLTEYVYVARKTTKHGSNLSKKSYIIRLFLNDYILKLKQPLEPRAFLHKSHSAPPLNLFFENLAESDKSTNTLVIINTYILELIKEYCADTDEDTGEIFYVDGYRNPFQSFELEFQVTSGNIETKKAILPYHYIQKAAEYLCPTKAKSFSDLANAIRIYDTDFYEVDKSDIDENDENCVWRTREVYKSSGRFKETIFEMWSPVRTIALYTLHMLPLRGQQILWNDSGEADNHLPKFVNGEIKWVKNEHSSAGKFTTPQGFIFNTGSNIDADKSELGFYTTTNKTRNREGGYHAPYMPINLARWLILLRDWQIKYNPISKPSRWSEIYIPRKVDNRRLKIRGYKGQQCFLFRNPKEKSKLLKEHPVSTTCLKTALPILYFNIQEKKHPLAIKINEDDGVFSLTNYSSNFTVHSLRASLITAYIIDAKVSPVIVAKLVGHASIVMTIYYAVVAESEMRRTLTLAEELALAKSRDKMDDYLYNDSLKNIESLFCDTNGNEFLNNIGSISTIQKSMVQIFDYGICPFAGARCSEGGELVAEKSSFRKPVPAGYLGYQNCPQCRFFITGPMFLGGLKMLADEISLEAHVTSTRMGEIQAEILELENEWDEKGGEFLEDKQVSLTRKRNLYQQLVTKFDALAVDLIHVFRLSHAACQLIDKQDSDTNTKNIPMLVNEDVTINVGVDEVSYFRSLDTVCKNAELYAYANPSRAIPSRSQMLDAMSQINDIKSYLYSLTEQQQLKVGNQITQLLIERLGGWEKLDKVMDGENLLSDFIASPELKSLKREIATLSSEKIPNLRVIMGNK